jgi:predicted DNA-binding protein
MYKVIITTVLDPETKKRLSAHSKKTYIPYGKLIEYSINEFKSTAAKVKDYKFKHADFDRIKTQSFTSSVPDSINNVLLELSKKLDVSKRLLLREVITEYVNNNC